MDVVLFFNQLFSTGAMVRCVNCRKVYDGLKKVVDWGVTVCSDDGIGETTVEICSSCLLNPHTIYLSHVKQNLEKAKKPQFEIEQALEKLRLLKEGQLEPEDMF